MALRRQPLVSYFANACLRSDTFERDNKGYMLQVDVLFCIRMGRPSGDSSRFYF